MTRSLRHQTGSILQNILVDLPPRTELHAFGGVRTANDMTIKKLFCLLHGRLIVLTYKGCRRLCHY